MPVAGGGSSAVLKRSLRWAVSLKQRTIQRCGVIDEVRDRRVVGAGEREARPTRGDVHRLADHAAVDDHDHDLVGMGSGDPLDRALDAAPELVVGLGAGDDVPATGLEHRDRQRILVDHPAAQLATLPLAEEHLAQIGLDLRFDAEPLGERRRRLLRAPQRRDVDGGDPLAGRDQPVGDAARPARGPPAPAPGRRARRPA